MYIYMYTFESYRTHTNPDYRCRYKIGETQNDVKGRIAQQDSTANGEPPVCIAQWPVPDTVHDRSIHTKLEEMGFKRARADKQREWFIITGDNEKASIDIVEGIVDELVETSLNEQMLEVQKRGTSLNEQMLEVQRRKSLRIPPVQVEVQKEKKHKKKLTPLQQAEEKARRDATDDFIRRAKQHTPDTNTYTTHWDEW